YFDKKKVPVLIRRVDEDGLKIAEDITAYYDAEENWLRAGEKATVTTESVTGYTLTEEYSKTIYADPASTLLAAQVVTFAYKKNELCDIRVLFYYDGDETNILEEFAIKAEIGSTFTFTAPAAFQGFELIEAEATKTILVADLNPIIKFEYLDVRKTITVCSEIAGTIATEWTERVQKGTIRTILPPNKTGYLPVAYSLDDSAPVAIDASFSGCLIIVTEDTDLKFSYEKYAVEVTINAVSITTDEPIIPAVIVEVPRGSNYTAYAPYIDGYVVYGKSQETLTNLTAPAEVTFTYSENVALSTVSVKAIYGDSGELLDQRHYYDAVIGGSYEVRAPYLPGYILDDDLIKTVDPVLFGENIVEFKYILRDNVTIEFYEVGIEIPIRVINVPPYPIPRTYTIADLEDEVADGYYIFNPATSAAAGTTVPLLITEVLTEQIYKIYFDKKKVPVLIRRVDEDGLKIAEDITAYYDDEENWLRAGEKAVVTTEPAAGYTLTEGYSKTVYADPNSTLLATQIVTFIYKEIEPAQATTVRIRMVNAADADIIPGFDVPATVGSSLTYNAPILPGYYLTGPEAGTVNPVLPDGESEIIFTYAPLILLEISVYIVKDEGAPQLIELREVSAGTDAIVAVPYLPGYILKEYQEDNGPVEPAGDITHVGFSNISASHEVAFYYQNMENFAEDEFFNILVQGIDEDTGIDLYNHVIMVRRSDTETIEVSAFDVIGYELLSPSLLIVPADGSETNLVFTYGSTEIDVSVKAELKNKTPVPEFDEIYLPAHLGQPLTACAPYIPGYELADDLIKSIAAVSADNRTISFEYKKAEGNLLILLKEDNTNGRVIMACPDTIPLAEDREYKIEDYDLSPYFFAAIDPAQSYAVTGGELP
ncbi:MAG: MucBP domain-containing protein, partial [Clostridiales bacterium]|nr:MucBP domain-containing protein [Clostridiales bacterium]